jgi:GT2 family glycosyltransferase
VPEVAAERISIVIVSFNAREHLRRCLASIYEYMKGDFEVIVVDNASSDGAADMVAQEFPQANLIRNANNAGFAPAVNRGERETTGDVVALLNPDSILAQDPFSEPAAFMRANPDIGVVGLKVLDPDGSLQLSVRRFPGLEVALFNRYSLLTRLLPQNRFSRSYLMSDWRHDDLADVDWVSGACLMTTRAVIDRIGPLDEGYFWGFEDVDFCQRVHRAGLRVVYYPHTSIIHAIGASARTVPTKALVARHKGMWRYYKRYLASNRLMDALVYAGIWARCSVQVVSSSVRRWIAARR